MNTITIESREPEEVIDITKDVAAALGARRDGVCHLFTRHTTCAPTSRSANPSASCSSSSRARARARSTWTFDP
jgi:thiamine phosphate synthase YjbQ (UPF0047 family)